LIQLLTLNYRHYPQIMLSLVPLSPSRPAQSPLQFGKAYQLTLSFRAQ
jgi:hypothetical protein